ncbi:hypothetical protein HPA02_03910 [Bisbaumannia pacifica]|uniref:Glucuronyl hydrolase n=2 Tax=Bisbaumannia pacifica TaxID=77098 RepID=A0A510X3W4_9GAMM|nr:hypothetical protein HPA02_03910 [Halomonas pacifica]
MNSESHDFPPTDLSQVEVASAIDALLQRLEIIERACGDDFPLYLPGSDEGWVVSRGGSWLGGFWAGLWWLRARVTGVGGDCDKARRIGRRLDSKLHVRTLNRSMVFWYGAGPGALWFEDPEACRRLERAGEELTRAFDPELGFIPQGSDMGGGLEGKACVTVDPLAATLRLLARNAHGRFREVSWHHLQSTFDACGTEGGAWHERACYRQGLMVGEGVAGVWSRGQAWAMLGLVQAARLYGEPFLNGARRACEYWLESRPESLPENRLDHAGAGDDPSAAVIAALAMLGLDDLLGQAEPWRKHAKRLLSAVLRSQHLKIGGRTPGLFGGMHYHTREGEVLVESACSSFFLLSLLLVFDERIGSMDY